MVIYGVYIVSKSGGLIFNHDHSMPRIETEKTFSFPLDINLEFTKKKISVVFGQRDGIFGKLLEMQDFWKIMRNFDFSWTRFDCNQWNICKR